MIKMSIGLYGTAVVVYLHPVNGPGVRINYIRLLDTDEAVQVCWNPKGWVGT